MHDYHEDLSGFDAAQILHDGCAECEERGADVARAIAHLDSSNFERAWVRATTWNRLGLNNVSRAERPLLCALWAIQVHLERRGIEIGEVPTGARSL